MLAHRVHFQNAGTAFQQLLVDALLVGQREALARQREHRRATARDQAQHQVVFGEPLRQLQDALRSRHARCVGHRVRGFDHLDALFQTLGARWRVVVAGDDQARERGVGGPQRFDRVRHRAARFARAEHHGAAFGRRRQKGGGVVQRQSALHRHVKQVAQQRAGIVDGMLGHWGFRLSLGG